MALSCCTHISRIRKKNKTLYGFKVDLIDGQRSVWGVPRALAPARFLLALRQPPPPLHDRSIGYFVYKRSIYPSVRARWLYKVCQTVWCRPAEDDLLTDELAHLHMVNDRFKVRPLRALFFLCGLDALLDFSLLIIQLLKALQHKFFLHLSHLLDSYLMKYTKRRLPFSLLKYIRV